MSHAVSSDPVLVVRHTGQVFPLVQMPVAIGRQPGNTIILADPQVSRYHAVISWQGGSFVVEDSGSANGTYVDERRITDPRPLRQGSALRIGNTIFDVYLTPGSDPGGPQEQASQKAPGYPGEGLPERHTALPTVLGIVLAALILFCLGAAATVLWLNLRDSELVVAFQSPAGGEEVTAGQEVLLEAVASGARDITRLELTVDGVPVATAASGDPGGQSSLIASQWWVSAQAGPHTVSATAYTAKGRASMPVTLEITVVEGIGQVTPAPEEQPPTAPPTASPSSLPPTAPPLDTPTATATMAPTPTATASPTPTHTPTSMPTATGLPLPAIAFFRANPATVSSGQCSELEWGLVSDATTAAIDQGIGGVGTPGSQQVCPGETTTYVMTATGPGGSTMAVTTVTVSGAGVITATLTSQPALDGYVIGGQAPYNGLDIRSGNIAAASGERVYRGFLSFDLGDLPAGAAIQTAQLRFFQVAVVGEPYSKLGQLSLAYVDYGHSLDADDFDLPSLDSTPLISQPLPGVWHTVVGDSLATWIAQGLGAGRTRFQVRLQFALETDDGTTPDYAQFESGDNSFGTGNLPQLIVVYQP